MNEESLESEDLGRPVEELRVLDVSPPDGFVQRIRGSIQRRLFAGQVIDFGMRPFGGLFLEYVVLLLSLFNRSGGTNSGSDDER